MTMEYVNRRGDRYFVLQGKTKTGKPKYYCSKRTDALGVGVERLPDDYEIHENPETALVSVRKIRPTRVQPFEREALTRLANELAATPVLVDVEGDSLVVYASDVDPEASVRAMSLIFGDLGKHAAGQIDWVTRHAHYSPMLRFNLVDEDERLYSVERWCFRGRIDGWISLARGRPLERQAALYLPHVGVESFFELM